MQVLACLCSALRCRRLLCEGPIHTLHNCPSYLPQTVPGEHDWGGGGVALLQPPHSIIQSSTNVSCSSQYFANQSHMLHEDFSSPPKSGLNDVIPGSCVRLRSEELGWWSPHKRRLK